MNPRRQWVPAEATNSSRSPSIVGSASIGLQLRLKRDTLIGQTLWVATVNSPSRAQAVERRTLANARLAAMGGRKNRDRLVQRPGLRVVIGGLALRASTAAGLAVFAEQTVSIGEVAISSTHVGRRKREWMRQIVIPVRLGRAIATYLAVVTMGVRIPRAGVSAGRSKVGEHGEYPPVLLVGVGDV